jgi:hypothetical protein
VITSSIYRSQQVSKAHGQEWNADYFQSLQSITISSPSSPAQEFRTPPGAKKEEGRERSITIFIALMPP